MELLCIKTHAYKFVVATYSYIPQNIITCSCGTKHYYFGHNSGLKLSNGNIALGSYCEECNRQLSDNYLYIGQRYFGEISSIDENEQYEKSKELILKE